MRLLLVIALGAVAAALLTWWSGRAPPPAAGAGAAVAARSPGDTDAAALLYRWRDDDGTLQVSDRPPPAGRAHDVVDAAGLERRNVLDSPPQPASAVD